MIRSIAVVPHPPLLVPQLVGTAADEVEPLRTACQQAVRGLGAPRWHAVGVDESGPATIAPGTRGSFHGYGVDIPVTLGTVPEFGHDPGHDPASGLDSASGLACGPDCAPDSAPDCAPDGVVTTVLPMLVAGWLAGQVDGAVAVEGELLHPSTSAADCLARGRELAAERAGEWALLVLADGARTHPVPGAGRVDERAVGFDAAVADALAGADAAALADLDTALAAELGALGRAAWQLLAGVALGSGLRWTAELLHTGAPYGVGYHVALWRAAP